LQNSHNWQGAQKQMSRLLLVLLRFVLFLALSCNLTFS
jgi:hypothetical protein